MRKRWTVGIVGAGRIAQGFDKPSDKHILTMAHAIRASQRFTLGGFFDIDPRRSAAAEKKWKCPPSPRERAAWFAQGWDVIYIATPDQQHANDLKEALQQRPKAILAEKPLTITAQDAGSILQKAHHDRVALLVNYPRRWHSAIMKQQRDIKALGQPRLANFTYTGGSSHNGVHMMDLFHTLWEGPWSVADSIRSGRQYVVTLQGPSQVNITINDLPADPYFIFDMTVYCARGKLTVGGSPETLTLSRLMADPLYDGFNVSRTVKQVNLEKEPLILQSLEQLGDLIANPQKAQLHLEREMGSQRFTGELLNRLMHPDRESD